MTTVSPLTAFVIIYHFGLPVLLMLFFVLLLNCYNIYFNCYFALLSVSKAFLVASV